MTDNTDFTVVGVIGPPGVGKSTILNEIYSFDSSSPGMYVLLYSVCISLSFKSRSRLEIALYYARNESKKFENILRKGKEILKC